MGNTSERYTVSLIAKTRAFVKSMAQATKAMKMVGDMNRGIIKNLQKMSSAATKAGGKFNQTQQKMRNGITETEKETKKGTKAWKKYFKVFAAGAGLVGTFGVTMLGLSRILKRVRIGAAIQVQARAFANLAASHGENAKKMLKDLAEASKGTISNIEIMTTASRAIMLNIAPSKLVRLMEIARASAKAMGTTVAGAFSDIALGIGRQSRLILDNLGIIVRVKAAYDRYAFAIGVTADALTDFERQQAFANEVIRFGEKTRAAINADILDLQDNLARIDTVMKNVSQTINLQLAVAFATLWKVLEKREIISTTLEMIQVKLPQAMELTITLMITMLVVAEKVFQRIVKWMKDGAKISDAWAGVLIGIAALLGAVGAKMALPFLPLSGTAGFIAGATGMILTLSKLNKVLEELESSDGAKGNWVKDLKEIFKDIKAEVGEIAEGIGPAWEDALTPDRTQLEIALSKLKGFNLDVSDQLTSAKDLLNTWTGLGNNIKSANEEIEEILKTTNDLPKGTAAFEIALQKANAEISNIRDNVILIDLDIESTEEFNKTVRRAVAQIQRLLKNPKLLQTTQSRSLVFEALFKDVVDRTDDLTPEVKSIFMALQKEFGKLKDITETLPDSFSKGLNQWVDNYRDANNRMTTMGVEAAKAISKGFEDFFFNAVTGKLKTLQETFANFGTSILRSVSKALGDKATEEVLGIFGKGGNKVIDTQKQLVKVTDELREAFEKYVLSQAVQTGQAPNPVVLAGLGATGILPQGVLPPGTLSATAGLQAILNQKSAVPGTGTTPAAAAGAPAVNTPAVKAKTTAVTVSILDKVKKSMTDIYTKFSLFMGGLFKGVAGFFGGGSTTGSAVSGAAGAASGKVTGGILDKIKGSFKAGGKLEGVGSFFSKIGGGIKSIFGFADGGITSLAGSLSGAMMTSKPTLAAISETGKREAIVPLDRFADLIQQPSITINAIDTKSFQQYVNENKEILLGAVNSVRSPQYTGQMARGPF